MPTCRRDRALRLSVLRNPYPVTDARCVPLRRVHSATVRRGRIQDPPPGFLVGAAYMAARNQVPLPAVVVPTPSGRLLAARAQAALNAPLPNINT